MQPIAIGFETFLWYNVADFTRIVSFIIHCYLSASHLMREDTPEIKSRHTLGGRGTKFVWPTGKLRRTRYYRGDLRDTENGRKRRHEKLAPAQKRSLRGDVLRTTEVVLRTTELVTRSPRSNSAFSVGAV